MSRDHITNNIRLPHIHGNLANYCVEVFKVERPDDAPPGTVQEPWAYSIGLTVSDGEGKLFDSPYEAMNSAMSYLATVYRELEP